jgi:hypothetical protein
MQQHSHVIIGIHISDRVKRAAAVQKVFTQFGANIKTRIGLHDVTESASSPKGIIILEMVGNERQCLTILKKLAAIPGVEAKKMVFSHD